MTQDVLLSISGLHMSIQNGIVMENEEEMPIEVITPASYYCKNGKHYILYDDVQEGIPGVTKNRVKISDDKILEIVKNGVTNSHMVFEKNKHNVSYYETPYGQLQVGVRTKEISFLVEEECIHTEVEYELDVNHEAAAECRIVLDVRPKAAADSVFHQPPIR